MAQIKQLKDTKTNSAIYPVTHLQAVVGAESIVDTQEVIIEQLDSIHQYINSIDLESLAKEQTLTDLSTSVTTAKTSILNDINLVKQQISDIKLPEIDTSNLAQESTLQWVAQTSYDTMNTGFNSVNSTLNNIQGPNTEATNSAILALLEQAATSNDELIALQLQNIIG